MAETELPIETTPVYFAHAKLGLEMYLWQQSVVTWYERAAVSRVKGTLASPNGAGKDDRVISTLALWWVAMHERGRVIITSKDSRQLDEQTYPAIAKHRGKFEGWKFIERYIETPTGGKIILFTTDEPGRAEGWHKENDIDGPLLIIVNEAKSVPEDIFQAFDRCTYNGLLYASSPGAMVGSFYESHVRPELGFKRIKVGLSDCPHIPQERIMDVMTKYGPRHPFTLSTLHGEFMLADGESTFDNEGLVNLKAQAEAGHDRAALGNLEISRGTGSAIFMPDDNGWLWMDDGPEIGGEYLLFCDPNTMEQGEGTTERDNTACGVLRNAWVDEFGAEHKTQLVAAMTWPGGVKWHSDVTARRMKLLSDHYGQCMAVVEANNFGSALMKDCMAEGLKLWQRTKIDDVNPNKQLRINGYLTTERSREHWVQACAAIIREQALLCRYRPATNEFQTFIHLPSGRSEAQAGCHDDWVSGIGIGLVVKCWTRIPKPANTIRTSMTGRTLQSSGHPTHGACG